MDLAGNERIAAEMLHQARSEFLDAFARVEEAVVRLLARNALPSGNDLLKQKIDRFRASKASPQLSRESKRKAQQLLDKLEPLAEIRADIVHARLRVIGWDGEVRAAFLNARRLCDRAPLVRVLTRQEFSDLAKELGKLAKELAEV